MRLKTENGLYVETREDMETELVKYFLTIMKEYHLDRTKEIRKITRHIPRHVSTITKMSFF